MIRGTAGAWRKKLRDGSLVPAAGASASKSVNWGIIPKPVPEASGIYQGGVRKFCEQENMVTDEDPSDPHPRGWRTEGRSEMRHEERERDAHETQKGKRRAVEIEIQKLVEKKDMEREKGKRT